MICETCKKDHHQVVIIQKPLRFSYKSDVIELDQSKRYGNMIQENICMECLQVEVQELAKQCHTEYRILSMDGV